jgi:hypothetical protein
MQASFEKLKDGQLNAYALGCGYVQKWQHGNDYSVQLWIEGGSYHVMRNDIDPTTNNTMSFKEGNGFWDNYDTLTEARKAFKKAFRG